MSSTNIRRTPVVNLAVLGDESGTDGNYVDLSQYLHDFKFTLISDKGSNSFKYEIELINMDEAFGESLLSAFVIALGEQDSTNISVISTASPLLAIQWGYPNAMSSIHMARISDIAYKFSQKKEKILKLTCVDNGDLVKHYSKHPATTPSFPFSMKFGDNDTAEIEYNVQDPFVDFSLINPASKEELPFFDILKGLMASMVNALPGYHLMFEEIPEDEIHKSYTEIILHFIKMQVIEFYGTEDTIEDAANFPKDATIDELIELYRNHFEMNAGGDDIKSISLEQMSALKFNAWSKLFSMFDIDIENFTDEGRVKGQKYLPLKRSVVADYGKDGEITDLIPLSQLKNSSKLSDITPVVKANAAKNLMYNIAHVDNEFQYQSADLVAYFQTEIDAYNNNSANDRTVGTFEASLKIAINEDQANSITNSGAELQIVPRTIILRTTDNLPVWINGTKPLTIHGDLMARTSTMGSAIPLKDIRNALAAAIHDKEQKSIQSEVFTEEQRATYEITQTPDTVMFNDLSFADKTNLLYNNIHASIHSKRNKTIEESINTIIKTHNTLMLDSTSEIFAEPWPVTINHLNFSEVMDLYKGEDMLKNMPSTLYAIRSNANHTTNTSLKPVLSFNLNGFNPNPNVISLSYGAANSIVHHFDFTGDFRYLMNLLSTVATEKTLSTYAEHLTTESIKLEVLPVLSMILQDREFTEYLKSSEQGSKVFIMLANLALQMDHTGTMTTRDIDIESVKDAGLAVDLLESMSSSGTVGGLEEEELSTTILFLKAITNSVIAAALFNTVDTNTTSNYGLAGTNAYSVFISPHDKRYKEFAEKAKEQSDNLPVYRWFDDNSAIITFIGRTGLDGGSYNARTAIHHQSDYSQAIADKYSQLAKRNNELAARKMESMEPADVYVLKESNIFDTYDIKSKAFPKETRLALGWYAENVEEVWELKVKTLGIPEIDHMIDVSTPRVFKFTVHDLASEKDKIDSTTKQHWLSGVYRPIGISHHINPKSGYTSDFKLLKILRSRND